MPQPGLSSSPLDYLGRVRHVRAKPLPSGSGRYQGTSGRKHPPDIEGIETIYDDDWGHGSP
jgi:hypothetical protein